MNFSIIKNGQPLDRALYAWDEETKTLLTKEEGLFLDFSDMDGVTFITGSFCVFTTTSSNCIFKTGHTCIFDTGYNCVFDVGKDCSIVRRGVTDTMALPSDVVIKINGPDVTGYKIISYKTDLIKKIVNK